MQNDLDLIAVTFSLAKQHIRWGDRMHVLYLLITVTAIPIIGSDRDMLYVCPMDCVLIPWLRQIGLRLSWAEWAVSSKGNELKCATFAAQSNYRCLCRLNDSIFASFMCASDYN